MSSGWIWAIWTVLMAALTWCTLQFELGAYEVLIFILGALLLSIGAQALENRAAEADHSPAGV